MLQNDVAHYSNPDSDQPYVEARCLSHKAWKSVQQFEMGAWSEEKR